MSFFDIFKRNQSKPADVPKPTGFNSQLIEAIIDLFEGKEGSQQCVYNLLAKSELLVPLTETPSLGGAKASAFTTTTKRGGTAILCFTDVAALHSWKPGWGPAAAMNFLDLSKQVDGSGGNLDTIIINHAGPVWLEIRRAMVNDKVRWEMYWPKSPQDNGPNFKGHISTYPSQQGAQPDAGTGRKLTP